ncbi:MAG TPA: hypothetical protein VLI55_22715 [Bryobacteraceae bacterium]|nr:hypothetical protein [Bryobacteraceae bacterium]
MRIRFLALFALGGGIVCAQAPGPPPGGPPGLERGAMVPREFGIAGAHWKVVTGAPYSADVSNSLVQMLADGNAIHRTTTGKVARDSKGRTYLQETITEGPLARSGPTTLTFLTDPVAGYSYELNANTKTASRRPFRMPGVNGKRPPSAEFRPRHDPDAMTADLGTENVGGVNAQGKSITRTIPAGAIGNTQPIVSKSEVWYSPDLQIVVLSKRNDPRVGESTYTVSNISRGAPDASLFQVPSDYTVHDGFRARFAGPGGPGGHFESKPQ